MAKPPKRDPIDAYIDEVRDRHAGARANHAALLGALGKSLSQMGISGVEIGQGIVIHADDAPTAAPDPPEQTRWANHLGQGGYLGLLQIGNNRMFVKKSERMLEQPLGDVIDLAYLQATAPSATVYEAGEGPWPEAGWGAGSIRIFVGDAGEMAALAQNAAAVLQPAWRTGRSTHINQLGPVAVDLPLRVAAARRAERLNELHSDAGHVAAMALGEGKKALCALLAFEGAPGAGALDEAWRKPLVDFLREASKTKTVGKEYQLAHNKARMAVHKAMGTTIKLVD